MTRKWENQSERIQHELKALADHVPEILSVGLINTDGIRLGLYSKNPTAREAHIMSSLAQGESKNVGPEAEDRVAAISGAVSSLSERIISEIGSEGWDFSVIAGKRTKIFEQVVDAETILIVVAKLESSIDAILPELKDTCERLTKS